MNDKIKINVFDVENVKRVKAVKVEPNANGLTIIGGKNRQGKTSVLDAIAWTLGGNKYRPSEPYREGSTIPPSLHIVMSNGLIVERKGKNSDLKVIDPEGRKGGQQLLDEFVEQLAIDLPRFMNSDSKEKAKTLLQIIGVGEQLVKIETAEKELFARRTTIGQIADQKEKYAAEQTYYPDAPKDLVSASDLIKAQQDILAKNGENQRKRNNVVQLEMNLDGVYSKIKDLETRLDLLRNEQSNILRDLEIAHKDALDLQDEGTEELEKSLADIEKINEQVRANLNKDKAEEDAKQYRQQVQTLTVQIEYARKSKLELLKNANLPLEGLSVEDGELIYNGKKWDCMSGADQLIVSTAIVRKLNPKCGFVLLDKLEQMDIDELNQFGAWLEAEGLQAIATRVSTGDECSVIIEDGYSETVTQYQATEDQNSQAASFTEGVF